MSDGQLYSRLLLKKGHGYPVSLPKLSDDLPEPLRKRGLQPGDVCVRYPDGSLEQIFNITCPEGDLANRLGVPEGFMQVALGWDDIRKQVLCHPPESVISTATVQKKGGSVNANLNNLPPAVGAGVVFDLWTNSKQAALLYLPDGASSWDLRRVQIFRDHALKHRHNWYKFVKNDLEREIGSGGLILITGVTKSTSWCIATVDNSSGGGKVSLKLKAAQVAGVGGSYKWEWENASSSMYSGPHRSSGEEPWQEDQTLFLRGFQIIPSLFTTPKVVPIPTN